MFIYGKDENKKEARGWPILRCLQCEIYIFPHQLRIVFRQKVGKV